MPEFTSASLHPCPCAMHVACAGGAGTRPASNYKESGWHGVARDPAEHLRLPATGQDLPLLLELQPITAGLPCVSPAVPEHQDRTGWHIPSKEDAGAGSTHSWGWHKMLSGLSLQI